jgi:hypothetical protein
MNFNDYDILQRLREDYDNAIDYDSLFENEIEVKWLNSDEAAAYLKISVKTLHNLNSCGKIPYYKLVNRNRYLESELRALLLSDKRGVPYGN